MKKFSEILDQMKYAASVSNETFIPWMRFFMLILSSWPAIGVVLFLLICTGSDEIFDLFVIQCVIAGVLAVFGVDDSKMWKERP